jgi:hypothetical protein
MVRDKMWNRMKKRAKYRARDFVHRFRNDKSFRRDAFLTVFFMVLGAAAIAYFGNSPFLGVIAFAILMGVPVGAVIFLWGEVTDPGGRYFDDPPFDEPRDDLRDR